MESSQTPKKGSEKGVGPGKRVNELTLGGKKERIACRRLSARYVNTRSPGPTPSLAAAGNPYERRSFALEIEGWFVSQARGA